MTPSDCLFCGIAAHAIPATIVYEDDDILAFRDIVPQAPTHVLVISKMHVRSFDEMDTAPAELLPRLLATVRSVAKAEGLSENGYRVVTNIGTNGGQTVMHLHVHLLGGRAMTWPPG